MIWVVESRWKRSLVTNFGYLWAHDAWENNLESTLVRWSRQRFLLWPLGFSRPRISFIFSLFHLLLPLVPETTPWLLYELSAPSYGQPRNRKLPGAPPAARLSVTCTASFARISKQTESRFPLDLRYFRARTPCSLYLAHSHLPFSPQSSYSSSFRPLATPILWGGNSLGRVKSFASGASFHLMDIFIHLVDACCTTLFNSKQSPPFPCRRFMIQEWEFHIPILINYFQTLCSQIFTCLPFLTYDVFARFWEKQNSRLSVFYDTVE